MINNTFSKINTVHKFLAGTSIAFLKRIPYGDIQVPLYFKEISFKELVYYGMFIGAAHGAHVSFQPLIGDPAAYLFTALAGALLQGNPYCVNQNNLEINYPQASMVSGALCAFLGCKSFSFLSNTLGLGVIPGLLIDTAVVAISMCKFEEKVNDFAKWITQTHNENFISDRACCK